MLFYSLLPRLAVILTAVDGSGSDPCTAAVPAAPFIRSVAPLEADSWTKWLNFDLGQNETWRFGLLLLVILATLIIGRIVRFVLSQSARKLAQKEQTKLLGLFLRSLAGPSAMAIFAGGTYMARLCLKFAVPPRDEGFSVQIFVLWGRVCQAIIALGVAYLLYRMVDIIEHYLKLWTSKTRSNLDDMLVPVIRKSLRIFIVVLAGLFIADNILGMDIGTFLAAAGVGGLAFALAAKDTLANFFGSITIFADRPFQVGERIKVGGFDGPVEEVGFRSTRIRTLDGHVVSVPNSKIANEMVENIGKRPFIKRVANIGITYDTPIEKVEKAVQTIKDVLARTEEVNRDPELVPRVYFTEFKDFYLNILMIYWVTPPNYWDFQAVNQQVNLAIMRAFEAEGIKFAFPTQTLYVKKDD